MTQQTGSQSQAPSKPWEQSWNDVKAVDPKTVEATAPAVSAVAPWEKEWSNPVAPLTPKQIPVKEPAKASGDWGEINKQYAKGKSEREQEKLRILNEELANQTDPKNREILKREIARVKN